MVIHLFFTGWKVIIDMLLLLLLLGLTGRPCKGMGGVGGVPVHVTDLDVPMYASRGEDVEITCNYDIGYLQLYSIKWYFDDSEFFRYLPNEHPSLESFHHPGVKVDLSLSTGASVILMDVDVDSSGEYKCEVITDYPEFYTADKSKPMTVVEIPEEKPSIEGTKHQYHIGDQVKLKCIAPHSTPLAELTWFINHKQAPPQYLEQRRTVETGRGLEQRQLGLRFAVTKEHFENGEMSLRCSARIVSLYYKTQQHSVDGQLTYQVPLMDSMAVPISAGVNGLQSATQIIMTSLRILVMSLLVIFA